MGNDAAGKNGSRKIAAVFLLLLFSVGDLLAQVNFTAGANRTTIGKNEQFTVEFKINSRGNNFEAPSFENFRVLGGPNTSQSTYMDNQGMRMNISYSYVLMPMETGVFQIGPARITVDGKVYSTEPIKITVQQTSPRAGDPNDPYSIAAKSAFLRILTSNRSIYQGEPFVASYKLYFKTDIGRPEMLDEPDFTGFFKEDINLNRIETQTDTYEGEMYTTGIIRQMVLIPQKSGSIRPGLVEVRIPTQVPSNRRDFFGRRISQTVNQTATENFPGITVKPLPENGKPSDFSGAVGDFSMDVSVSRKELTANESVTLKIKISGRGNIKLVDAPEPEIPSAFEVYDPKSTENISINASGMSGSKTYEYLLIPRYGGTYKIPEIQFSYFDPGSGSYKTLKSESYEITVTGAPAQPGQASGGIANTPQEEVNFIGKDILYIKTRPGNFQKRDHAFLGSSLFYTLAGGTGLVSLGMLAFFFFAANRKTDYTKQRQGKAGKVARKHLREAKKELDKGQKDEFYLALSTALWGYFSDRFNIPQSKMNKDVIQEELRSRNIEEQLAERVLQMMNRAEMARFTSMAPSAPAEDYKETAQLITEIESRL